MTRTNFVIGVLLTLAASVCLLIVAQRYDLDPDLVAWMTRLIVAGFLGFLVGLGLAGRGRREGPQ